MRRSLLIQGGIQGSAVLSSGPFGLEKWGRSRRCRAPQESGVFEVFFLRAVDVEEMHWENGCAGQRQGDVRVPLGLLTLREGY